MRIRVEWFLPDMGGGEDTGVEGFLPDMGGGEDTGRMVLT